MVEAFHVEHIALHRQLGATIPLAFPRHMDPHLMGARHMDRGIAVPSGASPVVGATTGPTVARHRSPP